MDVLSALDMVFVEQFIAEVLTLRVSNEARDDQMVSISDIVDSRAERRLTLNQREDLTEHRRNNDERNQTDEDTNDLTNRGCRIDVTIPDREQRDDDEV